jgi:hypothetical protein
MQSTYSAEQVVGFKFRGGHDVDGASQHGRYLLVEVDYVDD